MADEIIKELTDLAVDLYQEGYHCGLSGPEADTWLRAWAISMQRVAQGEKYSSDLVYEVFKSISEASE